MKYIRILAEFHGRAWALPEDLLLRMQDLLCAQASGAKWSDAEIENRIADANGLSGYEAREHLGGIRYSALGAVAASDRRPARNAGKVAVIPITGLISHRMNMVSQISGSGGTSIQKLQAQFREAMRASDCKAIVFDVDSPGGSVDCVPELSSEIYEARRQKPIIAVCNSMACSAAYWLASAASEVVCTPSGQCGSIGVFMMLQDESKALDKAGIKITVIKAGKYKAEGNPAEPLSREAHDAFQSQVDAVYGIFTGSVARNRGTSQAAVRDGYGQGRSVMATAAVRANLADRVGTLDSVLQELGVGGAGRPGMPAGMPRDAQLVGDHIDAPYRAALHRRRQQVELDLMRMKAGTPSERTEAPENYMDGIQRRRRQLRELAADMPISRPAPGAALASASNRRRQLEIDLWR